MSGSQPSDTKTTDKIRISIADDSGVIRQDLKVLLETEPAFDIVGIANNGKSAIELVETLKPDIILIDMEMPELNGISSNAIISDRSFIRRVR